MKRRRKSTSRKTNITIYHHELNMEYQNATTFWLITEIVNNKPLLTYYYKIPDNYKDNSLLGELHERYCQYCPN
jgi:abortive infection bacteriophage resistance protein